jgi:hypothetical protein
MSTASRDEKKSLNESGVNCEIKKGPVKTGP